MIGGLTIVVPGEPVGKGRPRFSGKSSKPYTPARTVAHEKAMAWAGKLAMRGYPPVTDQLEVTFTAFFPIPESWTKEKTARALDGSFRRAPVDLDNLVKCLDALNGIVWHDDTQIVRLTASKGYAAEPKTIIGIKPLDTPHE